jgi:hypothetical protein
MEQAGALKCGLLPQNIGVDENPGFQSGIIDVVFWVFMILLAYYVRVGAN